MIIIGGETMLDTDFVETCNFNGWNCIAPPKKLSQLETSKYFTRLFLNEHGLDDFNPKFSLLSETSCIETILEKYDEFVIKLDGLAGGKGVYVQGDHFENKREGIDIIQQKISCGDIVIEEKLIGEEFSVFTLSDGDYFIHLPPVKDFKRAFEYNIGPNTGGMGSIMENFDFLNRQDMMKCCQLNSIVLQQIQNRFSQRYVGVLYGSFMKTKDNQIKLIEYNCRFGDSEVFNVLNNIETDLTSIFKSMIDNTLHTVDFVLKNTVSVVKYLVPKGYPEKPLKTNINYKTIDNVYTSSLDKDCNLLGSRALAIYSEGKDIEEACEKCEKIISRINTENLYWRKDIGLKNNDAYKSAGVDINEGNKFVKLIKKDVESTYTEDVVGQHGNFGGQFKFNNDVLVASTDGVGTKGILIKQQTGNYYTCGHDIVNHSVNDILVQGATPLFFLDYIASSKLNIEDSASFVKGCCDACKKVECVVIGGETAEMPSVYKDGHMDMVGTIVGKKIIPLCGVQKGDIAIGLASSGPQTNGYTLIRKIMDTHSPPDDVLQAFLKPHGSFLEQVMKINNEFTITGMCHITGGGLTENLKRVIPNELSIKLDKLQYPEWCEWLKMKGNLTDNEMKKIFNCGIGFIVFVKPQKKQMSSNVDKRLFTLSGIPYDCRYSSEKKLKIGILGSTNGTDMDHIIKTINNPHYEFYNRVEISCVLSNKKDSGILNKSCSYGIYSEYVPYVSTNGKEAYDEILISKFEAKEIDMVLCIGWMRILTSTFIKRWKKCCFNVHPSLLPAFAGGMDKNVHQEVLNSGNRETGCTVHEVTEEVDKGPIIVQKKCEVLDNDSVDSLKARVQELEGKALVETISLFASDKIGPLSEVTIEKFGIDLGKVF
jgi:formyltetrahydrofolate-dependent phosphoribosylglycinamide formyltransferase